MRLFKKDLNKGIDKQRNNEKIISLIARWWQNNNEKTYSAVVKELLEGNSYLLLPSQNDESGNNEWHVSEKDSSLKLTSLFNKDGLKVLGAFTDEESILQWAKEALSYTAMLSKNVLSLCENENIGRLVINSGSENKSFFLEQSVGKTKEYIIEKNNKIRVGAPARPLNDRIIKKLVSSFQSIDTIQEAYQYCQTTDKNKDQSIMIAVKLSKISRDSKLAVTQAIQQAIENETFTDQFVDTHVIKTEEDYQIIKGIDNSLFYKR